MSDLEAVLDRLAEGATLTGACRVIGQGVSFHKHAVERSEAGDPDFVVTWRGERRRYAELVPIVKAIGRVKRETELRTVRVNNEVVWVEDGALKAKFVVYGDDAKDVAEMHGYKDWPYAHSIITGERIPLLAARFPRPGRSMPRPQRIHRPAPAPEAEPLPTWQPEMGVPAYARGVRAPVPPPKVNIHTPSSPMVQELREKAALLKERGPAIPRPVSKEGRPMAASSLYVHAPQRVDEPKEKVGNQ